MIHKNISNWTMSQRILFGLAQIIDGLVRVLSIGYFYTNSSLTVSREVSRYHLKKLKERNLVEDEK